MYVSGYGPIYRQATTVRKTLIPSGFDFFVIFCLQKMVQKYLQNVISRQYFTISFFCFNFSPYRTLITEKAGFFFFRKEERMEDLGHQPEVLGGLALSESDLSLMNLHQVRNQLECSHLQESSRK
jgi:hypothetical protein